VKFSTIVSVYAKDCPEHLESALRSVWDQQELKPDQLVLVKDGPLPKILEDQLHRWQDRLGDQAVTVSLPENHGLSTALNAGLAHCRHDLVARMDADDISLPARFAKQVAQFVANPSLSIAGTFVQEIDEHTKRGHTRRVPTRHEQILDSLYLCPLIHPTIMFRKSEILRAGGYNEKLQRRQDYELWFRCAKQGLAFGNLPEILLLYRFNAGTHKKQSVKMALQQSMIGYRGSRELGLSACKRMACFVPFLRSLLPAPFQHRAYRVLKTLDPREYSQRFSNRAF